MPVTASWVMSKARSTPAADIFPPPAPKKVAAGNFSRNAPTNSEASKSPLVSPAISMKDLGIIGLPSGSCAARTVLFDQLHLPGDFKRQIQRPFGGFAADD